MRFRRGNRRIVAAMADSHAGHQLGLLNPDTVLEREDDDGGIEWYTPGSTKTQRKMWSVYQKHITKVLDFADGDDVLLLHNGDATHGDRYPNGLMDIPPSDQIEVALYNFRPWLRHKNVKTVRFLSGTTAHVLIGSVRTEARIASRLANEFPSADIASAHHERIDVGEVFDVTHHGPGKGSRDWLEGNVARFYLRDKIYRDRKLKKAPARVYLRGHYHVFCWETLREIWEFRLRRSDLIVVPSYCGMAHYARQVTRSDSELAYGMVAFEIIDGKMGHTEPFIKTEDLRVCEKL